MTQSSNHAKVLVPIIRRVMPSVIANQIIGSQSMTGPSASILSLRAQYTSNRIPMDKDKYKVFLRLNDRKKRQRREDFYKAKYPYVDADLNKNWQEIHTWCEGFIGKNNYVWYGERFFFENEDDRTLFILAGWAA